MVAANNTRTVLVIDDESRKVFCGGCTNRVKRLKQFVKDIDVHIPQVRIEARIVIADKHFEEALGMRFSGIYDRKDEIKHGFDFTRVGSSRHDDEQKNTRPPWHLNPLPFSGEKQSTARIPLFFGGPNLDTRRLNALLIAAEHKNKLRTILKPTILTNDKEMAEILEGEVVPIETVTEESIEGRLRNVRTAHYKDVGVQLRVRPLVSPDRTAVTLDLFVENSMVDEPSAGTSSHGGPVYPTIITSRSKTRVKLASGQTTMIGGLIKNRKNSRLSGIPFLSRIPLIGWLFKGKRKEFKDSQLLVFVTPTIVE